MAKIASRSSNGRGSGGPQRLRCAIYTRKSSEEGLEQAFNSLDAQRDACEAYIRSQKHEGWVALPTHYDDGGLSGGTMERPALQQLLADIRAGKVDLIVVYKVDRLTRSLADFAKIVEIFDTHGVSFVSVTQQFNTTTSMGRLTLNMLLSFAQFEREITGERIRDKFAASRRKGMWMGGTVPLGYTVQDRKLAIVPEEAERVRHIFRRYAELGSVLALQVELLADGILSKAGRELSRGALFHLLQNQLYRGQAVHKGNVYQGEHPALLDEPLWISVQERLANNRSDRSQAKRRKTPALLLGLAYDASGDRLTPTHAIRRGTRYRYYVSHRLITKGRSQAANGVRIPATELERLVTDALLSLLVDPQQLLSAMVDVGAGPQNLHQRQQIIQAAKAAADQWSKASPTEQHELLHRFVQRVEMQEGNVLLQIATREFTLPTSGGANIIEPMPIIMTVPSTLQRAGREMALVVGEQDPPARRNPNLVRLIVRAQALRDALIEGGKESLDVIVEREGISRSYLTRMVRLAYLAPNLVEAIMAGTQGPTITPSRLMRDTRLPLDWQEQQQVLAIA